MRDKALLRQLQALPLDAKVLMTQQRIREWHDHWHGDVYISFSGGKDSTVLTHLVHDMYPDVPLVFANTGLEYPEIQAFARQMGAEFVRPKMSFSEVISNYGYPIIGKEIAEAISYARRIVLNSEGGGGTQEKKRTEMRGERIDRTSRTDRVEESESHREYSATQTTRKNREAIRRRSDINGNRSHYERSKDSEINSWGSDGIGVGFSQFNKKKWLPLCNETQFKISHYCCNVMKKSPMGIYQRKTGLRPFIGTMAEESRMRAQAWIRHGCNSFEGHKQTSQPMSFWTEQDVLHYIKREGIEICSVYGDILASDDTGMLYEPIPGVECDLKCTGCQRTGCVFCGFGIHLEKGETRFQRLAKTHPRQYEYCMNGGQWVDNPDYDPAAPEYDGAWKNWNPKKIWVPSKEGLGMRKVFEDCNEIYGKDFVRYE